MIYSQPGSYFVTICTKDRRCLFDVDNNPMQLNDIGQFVKHWWNELPNKFPTIKIHEYAIMPNHIHGIIDIVETGTHTGVPLHRVVQWFKTMTSNNYFKYIKQNRLLETGKLWQRNYFEHVIRNEKDLNEIRQYISNNPINWQFDRGSGVLFCRIFIPSRIDS